MDDSLQKLISLGLRAPSILLPESADARKWAVIACDQYTQDRGFWEKAREAALNSPSTLNLIFPEIFLSDADVKSRIENIHLTMERYLKEDVFYSPGRGFIYIERDTPFHKKRRGLVAAVDLEKYEWAPLSRPLIRASEGTVPDRLPPRMDIRRGAALELPHILLLIDDDKDSLLFSLEDLAKKNAPLYDAPLMMDAGRVAGWFLGAEEDGLPSRAADLIAEKLDALKTRSVSRYGPEKDAFLFAVGDGNHSLAAAKGIWEEIKAANGSALLNDPRRYALVEIENIYDPAIQFEPIHRLVFDADFDAVVSLLSGLPDFSLSSARSIEELIERLRAKGLRSRYLRNEFLRDDPASNYFGVISNNRYALIETSATGIAAALLQPLLDNASLDGKPLSIDYIHDENELLRLAVSPEKRAVGILLPPAQKSGLFETVARFGPLPRKSFSMGHSMEKRFYFECRKLTLS